MSCVRTVLEDDVTHVLHPMDNGVWCGGRSLAFVSVSPVKSLKAPVSGVYCCSLHVADSHIWSGWSNGMLAVHDAIEHMLVFKELTHKGKVISLLSSEDGVLSISEDGSVHEWDPNSYTSKCLLVHTKNLLCSTIWGTVLLTGDADKSVVLWDTLKGDVITQLGSSSNVTALAMDGKRLKHGAFGSVWGGTADGTIRVWSLSTATLLSSSQAHSHALMQIWMPGSHDDMVTIDTAGTAIMWDPDALLMKQKYSTCKGTFIAAQPVGNVIWLSNEEGGVHVWKMPHTPTDVDTLASDESSQEHKTKVQLQEERVHDQLEELLELEKQKSANLERTLSRESARTQNEMHESETAKQELEAAKKRIAELDIKISEQTVELKTLAQAVKTEEKQGLVERQQRKEADDRCTQLDTRVQQLQEEVQENKVLRENLKTANHMVEAAGAEMAKCRKREEDCKQYSKLLMEELNDVKNKTHTNADLVPSLRKERDDAMQLVQDLRSTNATLRSAGEDEKERQQALEDEVTRLQDAVKTATSSLRELSDNKEQRDKDYLQLKTSLELHTEECRILKEENAKLCEQITATTQERGQRDLALETNLTQAEKSILHEENSRLKKQIKEQEAFLNHQESEIKNFQQLVSTAVDRSEREAAQLKQELEAQRAEVASKEVTIIALQSKQQQLVDDSSTLREAIKVHEEVEQGDYELLVASVTESKKQLKDLKKKRQGDKAAIRELHQLAIELASQSRALASEVTKAEEEKQQAQTLASSLQTEIELLHNQLGAKERNQEHGTRGTVLSGTDVAELHKDIDKLKEENATSLRHARDSESRVSAVAMELAAALEALEQQRRTSARQESQLSAAHSDRDAAQHMVYELKERLQEAEKVLKQVNTEAEALKEEIGAQRSSVLQYKSTCTEMKVALNEKKQECLNMTERLQIEEELINQLRKREKEDKLVILTGTSHTLILGVTNMTEEVGYTQLKLQGELTEAKAALQEKHTELDILRCELFKSLEENGVLVEQLSLQKEESDSTIQDQVGSMKELHSKLGNMSQMLGVTELRLENEVKNRSKAPLYPEAVGVNMPDCCRYFTWRGVDGGYPVYGCKDMILLQTTTGCVLQKGVEQWAHATGLNLRDSETFDAVWTDSQGSMLSQSITCEGAVDFTQFYDDEVKKCDLLHKELAECTVEITTLRAQLVLAQQQAVDFGLLREASVLELRKLQCDHKLLVGETSVLRTTVSDTEQQLHAIERKLEEDTSIRSGSRPDLQDDVMIALDERVRRALERNYLYGTVDASVSKELRDNPALPIAERLQRALQKEKLILAEEGLEEGPGYAALDDAELPVKERLSRALKRLEVIHEIHTEDTSPPLPRAVLPDDALLPRKLQDGVSLPSAERLVRTHRREQWRLATCFPSQVGQVAPLRTRLAFAFKREAWVATIVPLKCKSQTRDSCHHVQKP